MNRINILNMETSNKIAAGEVVERPSSVVKELIENSLDAKAQNITIEIYDGGKQQIKVIDDGHGIHPDDLAKAFLPHGTSKISSIEDIYKIHTLGFRGEALPSIASISSVILKSRYMHDNFGKEISITGSNVDYIKEVGCNVGTYIEVNNLFFNVPARQKFLKTTQRESALISNIINRLALANHDVSFKYYNNNKKILTTFSSEDVKETIRAIYGKETYKNIIYFENHSDISSIYGYIGNSEISRGSRNNQTIFVNKRYIKSGLITAAVENAFKSFLTVNKYPFFVLFLDIYPELIDVNVHPTKSEIKFENEKIIYKLVFSAVHEAIAKNIKDSYNISSTSSSDKESILTVCDEVKNESPILKENTIKEVIQLPIDLKHDNMKSTIVREGNLDCKISFNTDKTSNQSQSSFDLLDNSISSKNEPPTILKENNVKDEDNTPDSTNTVEEAKFPPLTIIGQFNDTYILAENNDELYMIDQHAAHEKILYERYNNQILKNEVICQILMVPVVLELSYEDFSYYDENKFIFNQAGFDIELFGDNTINIKEAPMILGKVDVKNLFLEILNNIKNMGSGSLNEVKWRAIATLACKSAIKANHSLTNAEMITLVETLRYIEEPFHCPHGRPVIIKMTLKEIEKKFKRIH